MNPANPMNPENITCRIKNLYHEDKGNDFFTIIQQDGHKKLTYRQFIDHALSYGEEFTKLGIKPGDHVVIIQPHSLQLYASFVGLILIGAVPAVFSHPSIKHSLDAYKQTLYKLFAAHKTKFVITYPEMISEIKKNDECEVTVFSTSILESLPIGQVGCEDLPALEIGNNQCAFMQFSSGTTGLKKCVGITHRQLLWQIESYAKCISLNPKTDKIATWLPIYHDMGLITSFMMPLVTSTPVVAMSPFDWVKAPQTFFNIISEHRATLCWVPNFFLNFMARQPSVHSDSKTRLDSLRGVINCSEPLIADSHEIFESAFANMGFQKHAFAASYAMAEATFAITSGGFRDPLKFTRFSAPELLQKRARVASENDQQSKILVSSGRAISETNIYILGDDNKQLDAGHVGQIAVSSPSIVDGYFNNLEKTSQAFRDGVYLTGDVGFIYDEHLFVLGRSSDTIIIAGHNLYPQDLENTINESKLCIAGRCVAAGLDNPQTGTQDLVIILESEAPETAGISQKVTQTIQNVYDITPAYVHIVPPKWLTKSTSGKLSREANLKKFVEELDVRAPNAVQNNMTLDTNIENLRRVLANFLQGKLHQNLMITDDDSILSSGLLDSLSYAEFIYKIETTFAINFDIETVRSIENFDTINRIFKNMLSATPASSHTDEKREQFWHQAISKTVLNREAASRYRVAPHMRDADLLQKTNKTIKDHSFHLSQPNFKSDSLSINSDGFRISYHNGKSITMNDFKNYKGRKAAAIGNSTAFGIGSTKDQLVFHNILNASANDSMLWYNYAARSATFAIQSRIIESIVEKSIDDLFWFDFLDPLRNQLMNLIKHQQKTGCKPDNLLNYWDKIYLELISTIEDKIVNTLNHFSKNIKVTLGLAPTPAWIKRSCCAEESELVRIFDHQVNQLFTRTVLPWIFTKDLHLRYSKDIEKICTKNGFRFVDFNKEFERKPAPWMFVDRLHLADAGQKIVAETLKNYDDAN